MTSRHSFDQREQLALLAPNVRLEQLAELTHRPAHISRTLKLGDERVQALVVEQGLHDQRTSLLETRNKWEQRFLFFSEVRHIDSGEEGGERSSRCLRIVIAIGRFPETPRLDQSMVVVMRKRNQSRVPLHR